MTATAHMDPSTRGLTPAARLGESPDTLGEKAQAFVSETAGEVTDAAEFQHSTAEAYVDDKIDRDKTVAHNIVGAAITLGLSVIMLILMAIVAGYFVAEAPSNGAFSDAINQVESVGGTAFILLAVALLGVPVVAIVGYFMRSGLGGFINGGMRR